MRKPLSTLLLTTALPAFAIATPSATDILSPLQSGHMMSHRYHHRSLMKVPDLTREQHRQMGKLIGEQMKASHNITRRYLAKLLPSDQQALYNELKASRKKTQKEILTLLTPEQQKQRAQRKAERAEFQQWQADKNSKKN